MSFQIRKLGLDQDFKSSEFLPVLGFALDWNKLLGLEIVIQSSFPDLKYYVKTKLKTVYSVSKSCAFYMISFNSINCLCFEIELIA